MGILHHQQESCDSTDFHNQGKNHHLYQIYRILNFTIEIIICAVVQCRLRCSTVSLLTNQCVYRLLGENQEINFNDLKIILGLSRFPYLSTIDGLLA